MGGAKVSVQSTLYRLLKNSVHPSTELSANGISLEITSKYPFMLSVSKHVPLFFNSLFTLDTSPGFDFEIFRFFYRLCVCGSCIC